ncbi:MAG: PKD domain-containing protein [Bacteroidota bacterium]|nr:PKD domain-containing protein [Bacteroidota bacterium]MDX5429521.1 PKD domain-containing protein [Bacteroidota bacterium]MDX5468306.1 PKD domain-containing protein [Bacteroidota bacterium]
MKKLLLFVLFLIGLFSVEKAEASHVMGSDIVYRCVGNGKYEVLVRVYRDCNGIQLSQSNVVARCSSTTITISSQTKVSTRDITGIDANCPVQSRCKGSSFQYGVEEHIWKMTIDLSNYSCCEWTLSWEQCCRNGAITTGASGQNFFTTATLNKCVTPCNSSPDFTNPPVAIICHNQDFVFNNGALDTVDSGDSLSYELVNGLTGLNSSITYSGNFSPVRPMTFFGFPNQNLQWPAGFRLDPLTGDLLFRPTQVNQVAIVVIEVKEWRKVNGTMQVVGRTRRDMQIIVIPCPNNKVPKILPPYSKQACAGQTTCITITTDDDDTGDTVKISWNRGIRGATFTNNNGSVKHASGEVCWTPTKNDISNIPYTFTITARDDACPLAGQSVRAFSIFVRETPEAEVSTEVLTCGRVAINHTPEKSYAGYQFSYVIRDSLNRGVWSGNQQVDTAFLQPGIYRLFLNMQTSTPCFNIVTDTIEIPDFVQVTIPSDTFICNGYPMTINSSTRGGNSPYEYEWRRLADTTDSLLTTSANIIINPDTSQRYVVQVKDDNGCFNWDTVNVAWKPLPAVDLGPDKRVCNDVLVTLDAGTDTTELSYEWNTGDTTRVLLVKDSMNYIVRVTDTIGCYNFDTVQVRVNDPRPELGSDVWRCNLDTTRLTATGADTYKWYYADLYNPGGINTPIGTNDYYDYIVTQSRSFIVEGTQTYMGVTCTNRDSIRVNMNELPTIKFNPQGPHCVDAGPISLVTYLEFPTLFTGTWRSDVNSAFVKDGIFYPAISGPSTNGQEHQVIYRVTDNNGCTKEAPVRVQILPLPNIVVQDTIAICGDVTELKLNSAIVTHTPAMALGTPTWSSLDNNPTVNANIVKNPPNDQKLLVSNLPEGTSYSILYHYRNNTSKCSNQDTLVVRVKTVPKTDAGVLPQYCWNDPIFDLNADANPSPKGGTWSSTMPIDVTSDPGKALVKPENIGPGLKFEPNQPQVIFTYSYTLEGCTKTDNVSTIIKGIPDVTVTPLLGVCEDTNVINLETRGNPYIFGSGTWSGDGVSNNRFDPTAAGIGFHRLTYTFTRPTTRCTNSASFQTEVQAKPTLEFTSPGAACAGLSFELNVNIQNAPGFVWSTLGDGEFESKGSGRKTSNLLNTEYFPGSTDIANEGFFILGETTNPVYCQPARIAQPVQIYPIPSISIADPKDSCDVNFAYLRATTDAAPGYFLEWNFGDGSDTSGTDIPLVRHAFRDPGTYIINLKIRSAKEFGECENDAVPVDIEVWPTPDAVIGANRFKTTVALPGIQFQDKSTIGGGGTIDHWHWTFGDRNNSFSFEQNPFFEYPITEPTDTGAFPVTLYVRTPQGCFDFADAVIQIDPDITVFIPNAFTPDGFDDARNDRFFVIADGFETFEITIFNRWGEKMYYSTDIREGWDGKYKGVEAQQDVYVYVVRVTSLAGKEFEYYGTVTLLR